ncbi:intradiol ring-cleavage dioxygenase [Sandaracinobacter neustonicus]|uniref:Intradiol ring-cleavage dioxygenase n=1 Tax=Sandaracinobacter neustonicus TaxID=1715348 RepID=A0A501XNV9_9SPHN|nr:intradiol ring-cleavage dioxygenase [Sandaracinobacter neustonicus]TPE61837.1 intradiol ring-cleavage dioxygenase [Sandaracinobacter neustonicus]
MTAPSPPTADENRRRLLQSLLVAPAAALAPGSAARAAATPDANHLAATLGLISSNVCSVMPATTEGPYYLDPKLVRRDISEGRPGIPLRLQLQVVTADCRPLSGARVDIWHCDAQGDYSGFAGQGSDAVSDTAGQTFLRGTQPTDANGIASFETIYPGWYRGRTTHIHYKIFLNDRTVLTSQIFFPDALSEHIFEKAPAYRRSGQRDTLNSIDGIAAEAGEGAYAAIREQKDRYIAALVVGIDPAARWTEGGPGGRGPDGMRPGGPPPGGLKGRPPGPPPGMRDGRPDGPPPGGPGGPMGQRTETTPIFPGSGGG